METTLQKIGRVIPTEHDTPDLNVMAHDILQSLSGEDATFSLKSTYYKGKVYGLNMTKVSVNCKYHIDSFTPLVKRSIQGWLLVDYDPVNNKIVVDKAVQTKLPILEACHGACVLDSEGNYVGELMGYLDMDDFGSFKIGIWDLSTLDLTSSAGVFAQIKDKYIRDIRQSDFIGFVYNGDQKWTLRKTYEFISYGGDASDPVWTRQITTQPISISTQDVGYVHDAMLFKQNGKSADYATIVTQNSRIFAVSFMPFTGDGFQNGWDFDEYILTNVPSGVPIIPE